MPDPIHLLLSIPPKQSISSFMGYLKGKSSMMIFKDHRNLRYKYGNSNFWATGYYMCIFCNTWNNRYIYKEKHKINKKNYKNFF